MTGGDGNDDLDGGAGNDVLYDGPGDDHLSADEGDDIVYVGVGAEDVYGEPGADTIYVLNDGIRDEVYCADNTEKDGDPGDLIIFVGGRDALDHVNYCNFRTAQVVPLDSVLFP